MKCAIAALLFLSLFTGHCLPGSLAYGSPVDAGLRVKQLEQEIRTEESALIRLKKNYAVIQKEKELTADYPRQRSAIITRALADVLKEKQRLQNLNEFQRQQQEKARLGQEQRARLLKEKERLSEEQRQKQKALKREQEALRQRLQEEQVKKEAQQKQQQQEKIQQAKKEQEELLGQKQEALEKLRQARLIQQEKLQRQQQEKTRLGQEQRARLLKEKERLSEEQRQKQKALKRKREALKRRLHQEQLKSTNNPFSKKQLPAPKTVHPKKQKYAGPG